LFKRLNIERAGSSRVMLDSNLELELDYSCSMFKSNEKNLNLYITIYLS